MSEQESTDVEESANNFELSEISEIQDPETPPAQPSKIPCIQLLRSTPYGIELNALLRLALPLIGSYVSTMVNFLISVIYVGHLGATELDGAALGGMFCNVTGYSLIIGFLSAMDTLASQSYGASNFHRVGIILQRAVVISFILSLFISLVWLFSEQIFLFFGLSADVSLAV